ncbi:MAG: amidohydrolase family protein [Promethearchaeota archaeon]
MERILSPGPEGLDFKGIKLQLIVTNFDPNISKLDYLYEKLIEFGKILVIHIGTGPLPEYCLNKDLKLSPNVGVKKLSALLERFPELKVQVPHLGAVKFDEMFGLLESYRNLYFDTAMMLIDHKIFPSGVSSSSNNIPDIKKPYNSRRTLVLPQENLRKLILKYHRRVLFGSDFPNIPYSYEFIIDQMSNLVISGDRNENRKILENIMFKNAKRLYKL